MRVPREPTPFSARTPNPSFPRIGLTSKLRFDRRLIEHRPNLRDSLIAELIENVLSEVDPPAVHRETEKETLWPAVEAEPARDVRRVADQEFDVELKVRDLFEIALEHSAVTGEPERPAVVTRVGGNEAMQVQPVLPVQAGDVISLVLGERVFGHRATLRCFVPVLMGHSYRGIRSMRYGTDSTWKRHNDRGGPSSDTA